MERISSGGSKEVTEHIITILADDENHHDFLHSLTVVLSYLDHDDETAHDIELTDGVATMLARKICSIIDSKPVARARPHANSLSRVETLQVNLLLSALKTIILKSSEYTLKSYFQSLDVLPVLVKLVEIFSKKTDTRTVRYVMGRDMLLCKVAKILKRVSRHCTTDVDKILDLSLSMMKGNLASDIKIDSALAITCLVEIGAYGDDFNMYDKIESAARSLVATLTTAASAGVAVQKREAFAGLLALASSSQFARSLISKRRDTIKVVVHLLCHSTLGDQNLEALEMTSLLLNCSDSIGSLQAAPSFAGELLVEGLTVAATSERDTRFRQGVLCTLQNVVSDKRCTFVTQNESIVATLEDVAFTDREDTCKVMGAKVLSRLALSSNTTAVIRPRILSLMARLAASPNSEVRAEALAVLKEVSFNHPDTLRLDQQPQLLESIEHIIANETSSKEKTCSLEILRELSRESHNRNIISNTGSLTAELTSLLSRGARVNRMAYMHAVKTVLSLVLDGSCIQFSQLLPWFVTFANSTTNEQLKQDAVQAIVRVSKAILA